MAKIPFGKPYPGAEDVSLREGFASALVDGYLDLMPGDPGVYVYRKRPGLTLFATHADAKAIDSLYETNDGVLLGVSNGKVFRINSNGTLTAFTGSTLTVGNQCRWAEDGSNVYVAHGGKIAKVDTGALTVTLLSNSPNNATHIAYIEGYLLCNGGTGTGDVNYSDDKANGYNLSTSWEFFNNQKLPDGCLAVEGDWNELFAFGQKSVEVSINVGDAQIPWQPFEGTFAPYGTISGYSVVRLNGTFYFLGIYNDTPRVLRIEGREPKPISWPYDNVIEGLTLTNARAWGVVMNGKNFYVLTFPSNNLTLCYNVQQDHWSQLAYWTGTAYQAFLLNAYAFSTAQSKHFVGDRRANGRIYTMEGVSDDGSEIRFKLTSGWISWNTDRPKTGHRILYKVERGTAIDTSTPKFKVEFRDNGNATARPSRTVSLGASGDNEFYGSLNRCGQYQQRQHSIIHDDTKSDFVFVYADESYTVN